ncbi:ADP-ribosylation factor-like protein 2 isoform X1 [Manihot esculenta]|nr:ADP-ribosylation factor-like protein 2 isoform X1 [Manihot esculenta]
MMWASVRRKVLSGSSTTYLVEENMRLRTELQKKIQELEKYRLSGASLLILANKQDLKGALTPDEIAKVLNLENMDKTRHWKIVGCSAYIGEGLLERFDWLVQDMMIP